MTDAQMIAKLLRCPAEWAIRKGFTKERFAEAAREALLAEERRQSRTTSRLFGPLKLTKEDRVFVSRAKTWKPF